MGSPSPMGFCKSYLYPHGILTSAREHDRNRGNRLHWINCIFTESCLMAKEGPDSDCSHTLGSVLDWNSVCEFSGDKRSSKPEMLEGQSSLACWVELWTGNWIIEFGSWLFL